MLLLQQWLQELTRIGLLGLGHLFRGALNYNGATLVATDSFHGLALSANLSRDMLLLKRFSDSDPASQNGRLYELASCLGLEERFYDGTVPASVEWDIVRSRVSDLRDHAWNVLKKTVL